MAKKTPANPTADEILELWRFSLQAGLGDEKKFEQSITDKHAPLLLAAIKTRLGSGPFNDLEKQKTMIVATDTGRICRMLTTKKAKVSLEAFDAVFEVVKHFHQTCLSPQGPSILGAWCDEGSVPALPSPPRRRS